MSKGGAVFPLAVPVAPGGLMRQAKKDKPMADEFDTNIEEAMKEEGVMDTEQRREVVKGGESFLEQIDRVDAIHSKIREQVRRRMLDMDNQFHRNKLDLTMTHEREMQELMRRHDDQMHEMTAILGKLT